MKYERVKLKYIKAKALLTKVALDNTYFRSNVIQGHKTRYAVEPREILAQTAT